MSIVHTARSPRKPRTLYQRAVRWANANEKRDTWGAWSALVAGYEAGYRAKAKR